MMKISKIMNEMTKANKSFVSWKYVASLFLPPPPCPYFILLY
jgi:hypothetical protein